MRNIKNPKSDSLKSIPRYLSMYDDQFREIYIESTAQVRKDCDLIIQQVGSIESTANLIRDWLQQMVN